MLRFITFTFSLFMYLVPAHGDIRVTYTDSSPTDYFIIKNISGCLLTKGKITIDFSTSLGRLVFDIDRNGWSGLDEGPSFGSTYQPLTIVSGMQFVQNMSDVKDGDNRVELDFINFNFGDEIRFQVDVDDTSGIIHPSVSGAEIDGAALVVITPTVENRGTFDANAVAETTPTSCIS